MKSLNEKLAIEVMGWKTEHNWGTFWVNSEGRTLMYENQWNPTTDLNQLRECYLALSDDEKAVFAFHNRFAPADWVFTNPQSAAQAILKAKDGS